MKEYQITLIWGLAVFILVFIVNYFFILKLSYKNMLKNKKKKNKKELKDLVGLSYLIPKFNLKVDESNVNSLFLVTSLVNAFIIAIVVVIVYLIPWDTMFRMLLGFVLLFVLIYAMYEIVGRYYMKKGGK